MTTDRAIAAAAELSRLRSFEDAIDAAAPRLEENPMTTDTDTVTTALTATKVVFTYDVTGAPSIQLRYGKTRFLPSRAKVALAGGAVTGVELWGPNEKKDGTEGANIHEQHYSPGWQWNDAPEWVHDLVGQAEDRYTAMAAAVEGY